MMSPSPDKSSVAEGSQGNAFVDGPMSQRFNEADTKESTGIENHGASERPTLADQLRNRGDSFSHLDRHACDSMSDDDDEDGHDESDADPTKPHAKKRKFVGGKKREIKNAREKERSSRIAKQIDELRDMLTSCGVVVPKGTKSSVLTEVATFIRLLQQQQVRSEVYVSTSGWMYGFVSSRQACALSPPPPSFDRSIRAVTETCSYSKFS
jgi:Helix-loop-helix DNA-binding domain